MTDWKKIADPRDIIPELTSRIVVTAPESRPSEMPVLESPSDVWDLLRDADDLDREAFWVIPMKPDGELLGIYVAHIGGVDITIVEPPVVLRLCIILGASGFVAVHNHPSGDASPSLEDIALTKQMVKSASMFGIELVDHIIIARRKGFFSFAENELMPESPVMRWGAK